MTRFGLKFIIFGYYSAAIRQYPSHLTMLALIFSPTNRNSIVNIKTREEARGLLRDFLSANLRFLANPRKRDHLI